MHEKPWKYLNMTLTGRWWNLGMLIEERPGGWVLWWIIRSPRKNRAKLWRAWMFKDKKYVFEAERWRRSQRRGSNSRLPWSQHRAKNSLERSRGTAVKARKQKAALFKIWNNRLGWEYELLDFRGKVWFSRWRAWNTSRLRNGLNVCAQHKKSCLKFSMQQHSGRQYYNTGCSAEQTLFFVCGAQTLAFFRTNFFFSINCSHGRYTSSLSLPHPQISLKRPL